MVGGQLSLTGPLAHANHWYATVSRGYKAGGFNIGQFVPEDRRQFEPEFLWNAEAGVRAASIDARLQAQLAVFHMWREDQQVATSFQLDPGDPLSYVFYTDNAARGRNYGVEASASWQPLPALTIGATLGLLQTEYIGYQYGDRDLDGREQAHAPSYQYSLSAQWGGDDGWSARADLNGSDEFYFDASRRAPQFYTLLNLKPGCAWPLVDLCVGAERDRREVRGARLLFRSRAAGLREQALRAARRWPSHGRHVAVALVRFLHALEGERHAHRCRHQPVSARRTTPIGISSSGCSGMPGAVDNAMSTQVAGEHDAVFAALAAETRTTFAGEQRAVFVMKVLGGTPTSDER
jgi:hypothetical protein